MIFNNIYPLSSKTQYGLVKLYDDPDAVVPAQGAAPSMGALKASLSSRTFQSFSNLEQLGLSEENTLAEIGEAMPEYSYLYVSLTGEETPLTDSMKAADESGIVQIKKFEEGRFIVSHRYRGLYIDETHTCSTVTPSYGSWVMTLGANTAHPLPISLGGTGADTPKYALLNLGGAAKIQYGAELDKEITVLAAATKIKVGPYEFFAVSGSALLSAADSPFPNAEVFYRVYTDNDYTGTRRMVVAYRFSNKEIARRAIYNGAWYGGAWTYPPSSLSTSLTSTATNVAATSSAVKALQDGKAVKSHASTSTTYGVGTTSAYGHVKVTPTNGLNITNGTISMAAANGATPGSVSSGTQTFNGNKTFTGQVVVGNPAVTTQAARRIYAGTAEMTSGVTALTTGLIYMLYE